MTQNADSERLIAEALCPGDGDHFQRGWPCSWCRDAACRIADVLALTPKPKKKKKKADKP
jgi:hypothetical protein